MFPMLGNANALVKENYWHQQKYEDFKPIKNGPR